MKVGKILFLTFLVSLFSINIFSQEAEENAVEISSIEQETVTVGIPETEKNDTEIIPEIESSANVPDESENLQIENIPAEEKTVESAILETNVEEKTVEPEVSETNVEEKAVESEVSETDEKKEAIEEQKEERVPMQIKSISELNEEERKNELQDFSDLDKEETHKNPAWYDEIFNSDKPFFNRLDFIFGFEPTVYVNAHPKTISAPSPIVYPLYIGFNWPNDTFISFEPSFRYFSTYYLVNQDMVLPAEIENRTVISYSCMFNVPVVFRFSFWDKFDVKLNTGLGFLIRIPSLADGVASDDAGYYGTAQDDYEYIKNWLVLSWRFLYLSGGVDCLFKITDTLSIGPELSLYLPVGTIFSDWTVDGMMVSIGLKIAF